MGKLGITLLLLATCSFLNAETTKIFKVQATIVKGCQITNVEQSLDFNNHPALSQIKVDANISNTDQSWNIRCTEKMPVMLKLDGGNYYSNRNWRMKHQSNNEYIPYMLYRDSTKKVQYQTGQTVSLPVTTEQESTLQFSIYAVADLNNNSQPRSAGLYKDSVAITISW